MRRILALSFATLALAVACSSGGAQPAAPAGDLNGTNAPAPSAAPVRTAVPLPSGSAYDPYGY